MSVRIRGPTGPAGVYVNVKELPLGGTIVPDETNWLPVLGVNGPPTYSLLSVSVTLLDPLNATPLTVTVQVPDAALSSPLPDAHEREIVRALLVYV